MIARIVPIRQKLRRREKPSLFGPPALFEGEDAAAYEKLLERFTADSKPEDVFDEMWVRDLVDLTWETRRLRRLKAHLLTCVMRDNLSPIFEPINIVEKGSDRELSADEIAELWVARDPLAIEEVNQQLSSKGLTLEHVAALAFSARIEDFERIDRMITSAEARRNDALRELERHRETLARALRQTNGNVVEAEFEDVAPVRRRLRYKT
jgi:hypothetical protein